MDTFGYDRVNSTFTLGVFVLPNRVCYLKIPLEICRVYPFQVPGATQKHRGYVAVDIHSQDLQ